jgi:hypothetical protein
VRARGRAAVYRVARDKIGLLLAGGRAA